MWEGNEARARLPPVETIKALTCGTAHCYTTQPVSRWVHRQTHLVATFRDRSQQPVIPPVAQNPYDVRADIFKCFPDYFRGHIQSMDETKDILHSECFEFLAFVSESFLRFPSFCLYYCPCIMSTSSISTLSAFITVV